MCDVISFDNKGVGWVWFQSESDHKSRFIMRLDQYLVGLKDKTNIKDFRLWFCTTAELHSMREQDYAELEVYENQPMTKRRLEVIEEGK